MKHTYKLLALLAVALVLPNGACNDPLKVSIPTIVPPGSLSDSAALSTLRAGAIGDFSIAFSGDHPDGSGGTGEGVIMYGGLLADEWIDSETFPTRIEVDARTTQVTNADVDLWYRLLHQARNAAEKAAAQYAALSPNDAGHAEVLNLAGYTYLFFAETYCSGVPVSHLNSATGAITYGVPLTTQQLTDTAIARFNEALAVAAGVTNATLRQAMTNLARVGKARALVDKGDFATADTTVAPVPTNFAYLSEHSEISTFENNGLTPQYNNFRFGDRKAPIPLATGVEARLIQAEVALQPDTTNPAVGFFTALNDPRANPANRSYFNPSPFSRTDTLTNPVPVLADLAAADVTAAGGAVNLLFAERARWLWLTAHRLGDLRRLIRKYGRPANTVFPTGAYFKSNPSVYGNDVNIPVPVTERNNPNFTACLDRLP